MTVHLPAVTASGPQPLRLTRSMLERAWQKGELSVALPDGGRYPVKLEEQRVEPGAQWTVVGRVQTRVGPQAMVLTFGPDAVFGVLPLPDGSLLHVTTTKGNTQIARAGGLLPPSSKSALAADPDYLVPRIDGVEGANGAAASRATRVMDAKAVKAASTNEVEVVVLALYTDDLVELRGSVSAAKTEVTNLFAIANQSHLDSGTSVRLKVASLTRVPMDPSMDNHGALYALTDDTIEGVDVAKLRDDASADLVALLRPHRDSHGTCGLAWLNGGGRAPQSISDHFGVSVSNVAPCGPYVLVHELAHNMGSAHDRETQAINGHLEFGVYQHSFGYRQDGPPAFATIMAYVAGQPWLGYFSNPSSDLCGAACGIESRSDNVRSLNSMAAVIAAFRGPPGTLSIVDAEAYESEPGSVTSLVFQVRLSGDAPTGGVKFKVSLTGGNAQAGVDFLAPASTIHTIAEGERTTHVFIDVVGDSTDEPDETIQLRLTEVIGAQVHDGDAIGRILNDDPRVTISGRIRFEDGVPAPSVAFPMTVSGMSGPYDSTTIELSPPHFAYELSLVKGASLQFNIDPPAPFAILPFAIDEIESALVRDIELKKGFNISGQVTLPAGQPPLVGPMGLDIRASIDGVYQTLPYGQVEPPDFRYSHWVVPGAWLYLEVVPPAPYERFFAVHNDVQSDIVQDINLSTLPALVLWGGGRLTEGGVGHHGTLELIVELSAPAPAGGVRLRYRSVEGTATAGSDYTAIEGSMTIPEGERYAPTKAIDWFGDDQVEGDEHFDVVVSDVSGANPVVTRQRITLYEPDRWMSAPLPPQRK